MTPRQYTDRVTACLQGLSRKEREAIRQELDGHMEDHICALLELGYDRDLAEERTMARMGDPEEVGREMRKLYPLRWLLVRWCAMAVCAVLAALLITQVSWGTVWWNLHFRLADNPVNRYEMQTFAFLREHPVDVRMEIGGVTVRACAAGIMKTADYPYWGTWEDKPDTVHVAAITLCTYSTQWSDLSTQQYFPGYFRWSDRAYSTGCDATGGAGVTMIPVQPGQTAVTAVYQHYGKDLTMEIPLSWEGVT